MDNIISIQSNEKNDEGHNTAVLIFAKIPRENFVKTRLSDSILPSQDILKLYEAFLHDTIEQAANSSTGSVLMSLADNEEINSSVLSEIDFFNETDIQDRNKLSQVFHKQPQGTFGERMKASIKWAFNLNYKKLIILGADSPQIQPNLISESIKLLDHNDVILGPSAEGGIYLIGIKPNLSLEGFEDLFNGVELSNFAKFAKSQALAINILSELVDIDQESDLIGLIAWIESVEIQMKQNYRSISKSKISIPKHTSLAIKEMGLWISVDKKNNRGKKLNRLN